MGIDGDFTIDSSSSFPGFSQQHGPGYEQNGATVPAVFDNGNAHVAPPPIGLGFGQSRGDVLSVEEAP
jgi:hypothetical protein